MANGDFNHLPRRTTSDKVLSNKAFSTFKNSKYDGWQRCLTSMVYKFFDEMSPGSAIKSEIMLNQQSAKKLCEPIIWKFKRRKVYYCFKVIFKGYIHCKKLLPSSSPWCGIYDFFSLKEKLYFVLEISSFLCFYKIHQNLWRPHRHYYIMQVVFILISFESSVPSKWNLVKYWFAEWQTFPTCFWLNAGDWKLVPGPVFILVKWQWSEIWSFLIMKMYHC